MKVNRLWALLCVLVLLCPLMAASGCGYRDVSAGASRRPHLETVQVIDGYTVQVLPDVDGTARKARISQAWLVNYLHAFQLTNSARELEYRVFPYWETARAVPAIQTALARHGNAQFRDESGNTGSLKILGPSVIQMSIHGNRAAARQFDPAAIPKDAFVHSDEPIGTPVRDGIAVYRRPVFLKWFVLARQHPIRLAQPRVASLLKKAGLEQPWVAREVVDALVSTGYAELYFVNKPRTIHHAIFETDAAKAEEEAKRLLELTVQYDEMPPTSRLHGVDPEKPRSTMTLKFSDGRSDEHERWELEDDGVAVQIDKVKNGKTQELRYWQIEYKILLATMTE